jgi:hypothetical protein
MNDPLNVRVGERGVIRLFALNMPPEQVRFLAESGGEPGAADQLLGLSGLDPEQIDIIAVDALDDLGLAGYLAEGCAVPKDQIDRAQLRDVTGHVLLIRSRAFNNDAARLTPAPQLTLIATYCETQTDWSAEPIETASARPRLSPRAARSRATRIGFALFAVMMTLILIVVTLVAT